MSQVNETPPAFDVGINQRLALELAKLGITATVVGDDLTVTVEGVQVGAHIDDFTPFGEMWRLNLWVDVGEIDTAAAAASAEVVQSVVAMYGRRIRSVPVVDPVEAAEKRAADAELEAVAAQGVIDIVHNILESTLDVLPLGAEKHPRVAIALKVCSEVDALKEENAKLRAALRQVEMAARFPDASDAWDQVRDGVSVLHD